MAVKVIQGRVDTGRPRDVLGTLRRRISALKRNSRRFKIGISGIPEGGQSSRHLGFTPSHELYSMRLTDESLLTQAGLHTPAVPCC